MKFLIKDPGFERPPYDDGAALILHQMGPSHKTYQDSMFAKALNGFMDMTPGPARILDIPSGQCAYGSMVAKLFSGIVEYVGVDIDPTSICVARRFHNAQFIVGDVRNLDRLVDGKFDLVLSRSPNIWDTQLWNEAYAKARELMNDDGIMVTSAFSPEEHANHIDALVQAEFDIEKSVKNPYVVLVSEGTDNFCQDNYLTFARP